MNKEYNDAIRKIIESYPRGYSSILMRKTENHHLLNYIMEETKMYTDIKFGARLFMVLNGSFSFPSCQTCGRELRHDIPCDPLNGYLMKTCSHRCSRLNPSSIALYKRTSMEKYGCESPSKSKEIREKLSLRHKEKSLEEKERTNEKRRRSCIEKYGVDSVSKVMDIRMRARESFVNRSDIDREKSNLKRRKTKLLKYGSETYVNTKAIMESRNSRTDEEKRQTILSRKETCMRLYGVEYSCNTDAAKEAARVKRRKLYYNSTIISNEVAVPLFSEQEYVCSTDDSKLRWRCRKCGNEFESDTCEHQSHIARCMKCYPLKSSVYNEKLELLEYIKGIYHGEIIHGDRSLLFPYELDIYLPERKIAFEFDGLFWHSKNMGTDRNYHLSKTEKCENAGIQLIHVFENEWTCNREIVKSRIRNILGLYDVTVYARKCDVREIDSKTSNDFQRTNHLQGFVCSKVNLGLYHKEKLISVMTFSKSRMSKKCEWELLRFCNRLGYHVVGGAGKLLKHFERTYKPKSVVSYADRRWSCGNLYKKLGFTLDHMSPPNYWYFKHQTNTLEPRIKYQKHKLPNLLKVYDESKSEYENMKMNDYLRIFDCGNCVYVKNYDI